jgi:hypothetical protein
MLKETISVKIHYNKTILTYNNLHDNLSILAHTAIYPSELYLAYNKYSGEYICNTVKDAFLVELAKERQLKEVEAFILN